MKTTIGVCVMAAAVMAAAVAGAQDGGVRAAVEAANKQFSALYAKGNAAGLAGLYTTTAEAFPPNGDVVRGRPAIEKMWKGVIDSGIAQATLMTRDVESLGGDLAYETGMYELKTKDGKPADRGKYIVVWKRDGGKWMLHRDIWNSSMPAK